MAIVSMKTFYSLDKGKNLTRYVLVELGGVNMLVGGFPPPSWLFLFLLLALCVKIACDWGSQHACFSACAIVSTPLLGCDQITVLIVCPFATVFKNLNVHHIAPSGVFVLLVNSYWCF